MILDIDMQTEKKSEKFSMSPLNIGIDGKFSVI
jgi:hypothetical protein